MSWEDIEKKLAESGEWLTLKEDGESAAFVPLQPPEVTKVTSDRFGKREVFRVMVAQLADGPVLSAVVKMIDMGSRAMRAYQIVGKGAEGKRVICMTRHGAAGSQETTYTFDNVRDLDDSARSFVERAWYDWQALQGEEG